ncbi:MAG: hypothetical protein ACRDCC_08280 [Culicoidibacterales bacterium]
MIGNFKLFDKKAQKEKKEQIAQKNAKDWQPYDRVENNILYTKKNEIVMFLQIGAKNITLLSYEQQIGELLAFSSVLQALDVPIKFHSLSMPIDVKDYISGWTRHLETEYSDKKQELIKRYLQQGVYLSQSGEFNREFFISVYEKEGNEIELDKKIRQIQNEFGRTGLVTTVCNNIKITQILTKIFNPNEVKWVENGQAIMNIANNDFVAEIPKVKELEAEVKQLQSQIELLTAKNQRYESKQYD